MKKLTCAFVLAVSALTYTSFSHANMLTYNKNRNIEQVAAAMKRPMEVDLLTVGMSGNEGDNEALLIGFVFYYGVQKGFITAQDPRFKGSTEKLAIPLAMKDNFEAQRLLALYFNDIVKDTEKAYIWAYIASLNPNLPYKDKDKYYDLLKGISSKVSPEVKKKLIVKADELERKIRPYPDLEDNLPAKYDEYDSNIRFLLEIKNTRLKYKTSPALYPEVYYGSIILNGVKNKLLRWNDSRMNYETMDNLIGQRAREGVFSAISTMANTAIYNNRSREAYLWIKLYNKIAEHMKYQDKFYVKESAPLFNQLITQVEASITPEQKAEVMKEVETYFQNGTKDNNKNFRVMF